jgi:Ca2+/H+ antiporter, TMEM165/GDT1 family
MGGPAIDWTHAGPTVLAAFLASLVEFVEALTIVLAVGAVRGWRGALGGTGLALLVLLAIAVALGPALTRIPLDFVQLGVGTLILLFGMRWLRKAILRSAGVIPLHDEEAAYVKETALLRGLGSIGPGWDGVAVSAAFKITMIEGIEVVFIVVAMGAAGGGLLIPASLGAVVALLLVVALGLVLHRPVAMIPENTLKFVVGVLLCSFGTFWIGEGMGFVWPGGDWAIAALNAGFLAVAILLVQLCRARGPAAAALRDPDYRRQT